MGRKKKKDQPIQEPRPTCGECTEKYLSDNGLFYCPEVDEHVKAEDGMCNTKLKKLVEQAQAATGEQQTEEPGAEYPDDSGSDGPTDICYDCNHHRPSEIEDHVYCKKHGEDRPWDDCCDDWDGQEEQICCLCNNHRPIEDREDVIFCNISEDEKPIEHYCDIDDWTPIETKEQDSDGETSRSLSGQDITEDMPGPRETTDFHLYKFRDFEHEMSVALLEVYNYIARGGEGDPSITIKLTGFRDTIKAGIVVDLPHKIKASAGSVETVRENGTFRIVLDEQPGLFEKPANTGTEEEPPENPEGETTEESEGEPPETAKGSAAADTMDPDPEQTEESDAAA